MSDDGDRDAGDTGEEGGVERGGEGASADDAELEATSRFDRGNAPFVVAAFATLLVAIATHVGFDPAGQGTKRLFGAMAVANLVLAVLAVLRLRDRDELTLLRPRSGDLSIGALVAFLLYGMGYAFHALVTSPGRPGEGWIVRVYLMLGDPFSDARHVVALGVAAIGLLEELAWRGLVFPALESRLGTLRAAVLATLLFGLAHLPTAFRLVDPVAGPNPLLPVAALGCGAAWTYLRWRVDRLVPALLSHALFTWAIVEFPLWVP